MTWLLVGLTALAAPPDFDTFLERFAEKRAGIETLAARFEQETILPDEVLYTEGEILFVAPRRILYRTADPPRVTLIDDDRVYEYEPEIRQVAIYNLAAGAAADAFFLGFNRDVDRLREEYDLSLFGVEEDARGDIGVRLQPLPGDTEALFREVRLYLREADYLPYRILIQNDERTQTIIDVDTFEVNETPDPSEARLVLPEGTAIVEDNRFVEEVGPGGMLLPRDAAPRIEVDVAPLAPPATP